MLNKSQLVFLKKLNKTDKYYFSSLDAPVVSYLSNLGYVLKASESGDRWGNGAIWFCSITEKGKAYLYDVHKTNMRFFIPVSVSVCSLIVSILALLSSLLPSLLQCP